MIDGNCDIDIYPGAEIERLGRLNLLEKSGVVVIIIFVIVTVVIRAIIIPWSLRAGLDEAELGGLSALIVVLRLVASPSLATAVSSIHVGLPMCATAQHAIRHVMRLLLLRSGIWRILLGYAAHHAMRILRWLSMMRHHARRSSSLTIHVSAVDASISVNADAFIS